MPEPNSPPPALRISLNPACVLAQVDASHRFFEYMVEHPVVGNEAELQHLCFAAGWNRALRWIQQHPEIYSENEAVQRDHEHQQRIIQLAARWMAGVQHEDVCSALADEQGQVRDQAAPGSLLCDCGLRDSIENLPLSLANMIQAEWEKMEKHSEECRSGPPDGDCICGVER